MNRMTSTVLLILIGCSLGADAQGAWEFHNNGLRVLVVGKDADFEGARSYQVVVSDERRTLARLEVNRDGLVTDAWMTDLDRDGAFEVVVATAQLGGSEIGAVDVHEWRDFRFDSTRPAELTAEQRSGYRGNDQFTVVDGRLRRAYPLFVDRDGRPVPTGQMQKYEYRYSADRWQANIQ